MRSKEKKREKREKPTLPRERTKTNPKQQKAESKRFQTRKKTTKKRRKNYIENIKKKKHLLLAFESQEKINKAKETITTKLQAQQFFLSLSLPSENK